MTNSDLADTSTPVAGVIVASDTLETRIPAHCSAGSNKTCASLPSLQSGDALARSGLLCLEGVKSGHCAPGKENVCVVDRKHSKKNMKDGRLRGADNRGPPHQMALHSGRTCTVDGNST